MENKDTKNNFNHPAVIVTILILIFIGGYFLLNKTNNTQTMPENVPNPQQEQIDNLKKELEILKQKQSTDVKSLPSTPKEKSTAEITKEWSPRVAHIACTNDNINYSLGSGTFTEFVKGSPIILTNHHVVLHLLEIHKYIFLIQVVLVTPHKKM